VILFAPVQINLLAFKINEIDHNSSEVLGSSAMIDVFNSDKRNTGFGSQYGDANLMLLQSTAIFDGDFADNNAVKESLV